MVDVLDLAMKLAIRDKLDKCARALEKMQSARRDNWVAANKSSQVPVNVEFSVRYNRKLVKTGSWEATFKMLQQGKIPSAPMDYIASVRFACFRGDDEETFAIKEHPPFVLAMTIPRDKKLEAPILYATICLQTRWSVKEVRQDTSLAWSIDDDHSTKVTFHSWELGKTDSGDTHMMNGYFVVEKDQAQLYIPPPPVGPTDESEVDQELMVVQSRSYGEGPTSGETAVYTSPSTQPPPHFQAFWQQQGYDAPTPDGSSAQGVPGPSITSDAGQHYHGDAGVSSITNRLDRANLQDDDAAPTEYGGMADDAETDPGAFYTCPSDPEHVANDDDDVWMPRGYPLPGGRHPGFPQTRPGDYNDYNDERIGPWNDSSWWASSARTQTTRSSGTTGP